MVGPDPNLVEAPGAGSAHSKTPNPHRYLGQRRRFKVKSSGSRSSSRASSSCLHSRPASIAVFVTDGHARFTYPDGKTEDVNAKTGQVMYFPPLEHLPENLGDKPFEVIGIELKG